MKEVKCKYHKAQVSYMNMESVQFGEHCLTFALAFDLVQQR